MHKSSKNDCGCNEKPKHKHGHKHKKDKNKCKCCGDIVKSTLLSLITYMGSSGNTFPSLDAIVTIIFKTGKSETFTLSVEDNPMQIIDDSIQIFDNPTLTICMICLDSIAFINIEPYPLLRIHNDLTRIPSMAADNIDNTNNCSKCDCSKTMYNFINDQVLISKDLTLPNIDKIEINGIPVPNLDDWLSSNILVNNEKTIILLDPKTGDFNILFPCNIYEICIEDPPPPPPPPPIGCSFRTYTQGGWASPPSGNNAGMILQDNFTTVFPTGFLIGLNTRGLQFNASTNVQGFFPQNGPSSGLPTSLNTTLNVVNANSLNSYSPSRSVLWSQVVALTINVAFSNNGTISGFNSGFGNMIITTLTGTPTISQFLAAVNSAIANPTVTPNVYGLTSFGAINDMIKNLNESFDNGEQNPWVNDNLDCNNQ